MKIKHFFLVFAILCTGCQSKGIFTDAQISAMQKEGFSQNAEGWALGLPDNILFRFNEAELTPQSINTINHMALNLAVTGIRHVRIDGHTDNYGTENYNEQLSLRRAEAVADLWAKGASIPRSNIMIRSLGMKYPIATNKTEYGRAQNRRVAVVITSP